MKLLKSTRLPLIVLSLLVSMFFACKGDSETANQEKGEDALQELEESLEALKDGNGEVVAIEVLKEALPEKLLGMKRTTHNAQSSGIAGMNFSSAEAEYEDGDRRMKIGLVDTGGFGAALTSMASWSEIHVDNQSADGYERTIAIDGNKAFEKYNRKTQTGEIAMITDDRFVVSIETKNLSEKEIRKAISKIKIKG